jgi:Fur family iron response transcriptional regulator
MELYTDRLAESTMNHNNPSPLPGTLPTEVEAKLIAAGIHPTAQRIAICRYVLCEAHHPTAEEVKTWVDRHFPKMSLATVYNTLKALVRGGLLRELKMPHCGKVIYDNVVIEHFHFFDEKTGQLIDISAEEVEIHPKLRPGYRLIGIDVVLRGSRS